MYSYLVKVSSDCHLFFLVELCFVVDIDLNVNIDVIEVVTDVFVEVFYAFVLV